MDRNPFKANSHLLMALLALTFISTAEARGFGELGLQLFSGRIEDQTTNGNASSTRHFQLDIATGWHSQIGETQWMSYGLAFNSQRGFQSDADLSGYGLGAFVGWYHGPFSVRLDYIFLAEMKSQNITNETQFFDGSGFNLEARWLHWFEDADGAADGNGKSRKFALGPALAFKQIGFSKTRVGSLPETSANRKTEQFVPGLRGIFIF